MEAGTASAPLPDAAELQNALAGRRAVVTGGGRGIGEAVARALSHSGAALVVTARTAADVERVAAALREDGREAWAAACDVTDPESVRELARVAEARLGGVDVLVNAAGAAHSAPLPQVSLQDWNRLFAVNATGPLLCLQAFLPGMRSRGWGRVVNVASISGLSGARYVAAYAASKHAVVGLTRCAAAEVAADGVTVNAICPGYVDTEMTRESVERIVRRTGRTSEQALEALIQSTPQRRLIAPEEVAHLVLALCHPAARGVNGQAIVVDGGRLLA